MHPDGLGGLLDLNMSNQIVIKVYLVSRMTQEVSYMSSNRPLKNIVEY